MVSDIVLVAIFAVVGTLLGALIGLLAEPVRACFSRKAYQEQLRRTLYGDLIIKLHRVLGYYLEYKSNRDNLEYLKSPNKLEVAGPISFPDEVTAQAQYYQLTSEEFDPLASAYYRLRWVVNFTNQFGNRSHDDIDNAKQALKGLEENIRLAGYTINAAFKDSAHFLDKIDDGRLLRDWCKLCLELIEQPQWRELQMLGHLQDLRYLRDYCEAYSVMMDMKKGHLKEIAGAQFSSEPNRLQVFFMVRLGDSISRPYKRYVDSFGLAGDEMVLDYGSGWGQISQHIAERLSQGNGHLTCVDVSKVWIETIQKRLKKYPNVDYKLGDIAALDITDNAYDIVVVHFVLHHIEKNQRQEKVDILARKLKPHSRLFIREPTREQHGTPVVEIRTLMSTAGLHERESRMSRSLIMGEVFDGVFEKL